MDLFTTFVSFCHKMNSSKLHCFNMISQWNFEYIPSLLPQLQNITQIIL